MIEIKAFMKSKSQGGSSGGSSSKTTYVNTVVSEADHAARADKAKRADAADAADYATRAGTAVTANHATTADEISGDAETLLDYLFAGETDRIQKVLGSVEFSRLLTLAGGLKSSNIYNQGNLRNDGDIYSVGGITADGDITCGDTVKTKNLEVTGSAHFFELVIDKVKAMGGAVLITPADGFDVDLAEKTADGYILCWRCDDGNGKQRDNMWKVGDQALCMSFNQAKVGGDGAHDVHNKYYWALVTGVSDKAIPIEIDGVKYHYIAISSTDCDGTVNPEVGDSIVMLGYRGTDDAARQSAIYISAYSSLDSGLTAPLLAQYRGINDFNLASHRKSYFDAKGSRLVGDFETSSGQTMEEYVDGQVSGVSNELNGLRNDLDEKADKSELDDKASKDDMKTMESSILQTARQISLEVSEKYVGRRNLLVGSALRKQGDSVVIVLYGNMSNGEGIVINEGVDDVNCVKVTSKSPTQYCGLFWRASQAQNVKIKRNTKYVASVWVKCSNTNCNVRIEGIYHAGTSEAEKHGQVNKVTSYPTLKTGEWQLFTAVFSTGGDYDYMECNFWVASNSETTVYFCKPMLEEDDTYNGWTLSEQDYDYVGGNLLDNARTLAVGENLDNIGGSSIISQGYGYDSAVAYADNSNGNGNKEILNWRTTSGGNVSFAKGKDYILSFLAKGSGNMSCYLYCHANNNCFIFSENSQGYIKEKIVDGTSNFTLSSEWKRYWVHWRVLTDNPLPTDVLLRAIAGTTAYVTQPKLEEGATMTEWTERKTDLIDKASLKAAGINITSSAVELYGDQVKVSSTKGGTPTAMFTDGKVNANLIDADTITVNHLWAKDSNGNKIGHFGNIDGIGDAAKVGSAYCPLWVGGSTAANSFFRVSPQNGMEVTKGTIGGFAINSSSLGSAVNRTTDSEGNEDIGYGQADRMSLTNNFIVFNGTNRQAIIGQWSTLGIPILMRLQDEYSDIVTRYGAVISVKNKKGDAAAMVFGGGYTSGFALKTEVFTSSNKNISKDTNVALLNEWKTSYKLPDMQPYDDGHILMVKLIAGISATSERDSEVYLDAGTYTDSNGVKHQSFFLYDNNSKDKTMPIQSIGDAMIFVFEKNIVNGTSDKGCWVQFKCPREW